VEASVRRRRLCLTSVSGIRFPFRVSGGGVGFRVLVGEGVGVKTPRLPAPCASSPGQGRPARSESRPLLVLGHHEHRGEGRGEGTYPLGAAPLLVLGHQSRAVAATIGALKSLSVAHGASAGYGSPVASSAKARKWSLGVDSGL
jgi:hypothetical protein